MAGSIIPDDIWAEMLQKHREDGLNSAQIARLLRRKHNIFISRQGVWYRLDRLRFIVEKPGI